MELPFYLVDAFTSRPFEGNPAGVCLTDEPLDASLMQRIAAEINVSETAFLAARHDETYDLRWFSPLVEVPLCGHATLASAAVLVRERGDARSELVFHTRSGALTARREGQRLCLDLPLNPSRPIDAPLALIGALGVDSILHSEYAPHPRKYLIEVADEGTLRSIRPDFNAMLSATTRPNPGGLIVTSRSTAGFDFVSRYFNPWVGVNEDPVTGAAHTVLAGYWAARLGKREMRARQVSARGGDLLVRLRGAERVDLVGDAVVTVRGTLRVPDPVQNGGLHRGKGLMAPGP